MTTAIAIVASGLLCIVIGFFIGLFTCAIGYKQGWIIMEKPNA